MVDKDIALEVLRNKHKYLITLIRFDLAELACNMLAKMVITEQLMYEVRDVYNDSTTRGTKLLLAISEKIESEEDGNTFVIFLQILESIPYFCHCAKSLVQLYSKFQCCSVV